MDAQKLFDKTLDDLSAKLKKGDEYEILMSSSLLRKLLVDGENSLVCQIDKKKRPLRFFVNAREPLHKRIPTLFTDKDLLIYTWFPLDGLNPDTANKERDYNPVWLSFDDFLQQVVIFANGEEITIKELIKHLSDKEGGVHMQRREFEEKNQMMKELNERFGVGNLPAVLSTLKVIGQIVVRDLALFKDEPTAPQR